MRTNPKTENLQSSDVRSGPQSVGRVISILEALSGVTNSATLSELATSIDAPKTSLVGLLSGLTDAGCLERDETGRYRLGPRFISLAMQVTSGHDLISVARPIMAELAEAAGETAVLGTLAPDQVSAVYLHKVETSSPIRFAVTVGERRELYCTGIGKILLAHFAPRRLQRYLKSTKRQRFTPTTIVGSRALQAELENVRQSGLAFTNDERFTGVSGIAAPIYTGDGTVAAALLIAGPSERLRGDATRLASIVKASADECSRLLGGALRDEDREKQSGVAVNAG
jgi:DNA-binding IclR family transcriptional regulator